MTEEVAAQHIWDWADKLSDHTQRLHRSREVWKAIVEGEGTCGSCSKWITDACPREKHDNQRGQKFGPSCRATKCGEFSMSAYDTERIAGLRQEYATITKAAQS